MVRGRKQLQETGPTWRERWTAVPRRRKLLILGGLILLIAVALLITHCAQPKEIPAIELVPGEAVHTFTVTGEVRADVSQNVASTLNARIISIAVDEGDTVSQGQAVMRLEAVADPAQVAQAEARLAAARAQEQEVRRGPRVENIAELQASAKEAGARIQQAEAQRQEAQARVEQAKTELNRLATLYREGAISKQEYEQAATQYLALKRVVDQQAAAISAARAQQQAAQARLQEARAGSRSEDIAQAAAERRAAEAVVRAARAQLGERTVTAATSGVVTQRLAEPGDVVSPGQAVLEIANPASLEVIAFAEESDIDHVHNGMQAIVTMDAYPEQVFVGSVSRVGSRVNPENGTVEVEVTGLRRVSTQVTQIKTAKPFRLLPGMTVDVSLVAARYADALVVPASAVETTKTGAYQVYRFVPGACVEAIPVKAEAIGASGYRLIAGVEAHDFIAADARPALLETSRCAPGQAAPATGDAAADEDLAKVIGDEPAKAPPAAAAMTR